MNQIFNPETKTQIAEIVVEKEKELRQLSKSIYENCLKLAEHDTKQEAIETQIDLIKFSLQKEITEARCPETGKCLFTNDTARKSELILREQNHELLRGYRADRLSHIETAKHLQSLIEFQKRQFYMSEKVLLFLANQ